MVLRYFRGKMVQQLMFVSVWVPLITLGVCKYYEESEDDKVKYVFAKKCSLFYFVFTSSSLALSN